MFPLPLAVRLGQESLALAAGCLQLVAGHLHLATCAGTSAEPQLVWRRRSCPGLQRTQCWRHPCPESPPTLYLGSSLVGVGGEADQVSWRKQAEQQKGSCSQEPGAAHIQVRVAASYSSMGYRAKHYIKSQAIYQFLKHVSLLEGRVESCKLRPLLLR